MVTSAVVVEIPWQPARRIIRPNALGMLGRLGPLGIIGLLLMLLMVVVAILAPVLAPFDPNLINSGRQFVPPAFMSGGQQYLLGTDEFGRDLLSRIIWGARVSVAVSFSSVAIGSVIGGLLGLTSAFLGGKFDTFIQRVIDGIQAIPGLILALTIMAALGASMTNVIIAIALGLIVGQTRVMRATALGVIQNPYIESARSLGASGPWILLRHVLPNCLAPWIILCSAEIGGAILIEAALSFLGLGTPPPASSWGAMLSGGAQQYAQRAPWLAIFPGLAISAVVFGSNLLGDALRDVLDPRLRRA